MARVGDEMVEIKIHQPFRLPNAGRCGTEVELEANGVRGVGVCRNVATVGFFTSYGALLELCGDCAYLRPTDSFTAPGIRSNIQDFRGAERG